MGKLSILLCVLLLMGCGAENSGPAGGGNAASAPASSKEPETPREVVDAFVVAMDSLDALIIRRLFGKGEQERMAEQFAELKNVVDKIVITETSFEQSGEYWVFTYSQVAHMKDGKTDGDDRKIVYVVKEDGKWRLSGYKPR